MSKRLEDLYRMRSLIADKIAREEDLAALASGQPPVRTLTALEVAAELYGITVDQLLSDSRDRQVTKARQAAAWLLRSQGLSLPRIGVVLGRDHTTILYACRKIDNDPAVRAMLWPLLREVAA